MTKPVVFFSGLHSDLVPGQPAYITPVDHPSPLVSNTGPALTSPVVAVNDDGGFETLNTQYQPVPEDEENGHAA